jgi:phosphonate transport system ATP-binding protein
MSLMRPRDIEVAHTALRQVGIDEKLFNRTDELSGGQQQRVAIARVLIQDPEVILADEPVSSVDPSLATAIVKLLLEISEKTQKTLLMNLHSVDLALAYFPRVIGMKKGKAVFDLSPDRISDSLLDDLYSGHLPNDHQNELPDEESRALIYQ